MGKRKKWVGCRGWSVAVCALMIGGVMSGNSAFADTLVLKNGQTLEGIVEQETDAAVTLRMDVGRVTLPRSGITEVRRSAFSQNQTLAQAWRRADFTNPAYVPSGLETLGQLIGVLPDVKNSAQEALRALHVGREQVRQMLALRAQKERDAAAAMEQLRALGPVHDRNSQNQYNRIVHTANLARAEAVDLQNRAQGLTAHLDTLEKDIPGYTAAYTAAEAEWKRVESMLGSKRMNPEQQEFMTLAREALASFGRDFASIKVPCHKGPGGVMVDATINGRAQARLVLDTGASTVVFSSESARRLGLHPDTTRIVQITLADGRKQNAHPLWLESIEVAGARTTQAKALIMTDDAPVADMDGLLGMSFLGQFLVELNAASGTLTLRALRTTP